MMSNMLAAIAMRQTNLTPAQKVVLYWLADHCNDETGLCIPKVSTIAREAEISERSVHRQICDLEEKGYIVRQARKRADGKSTSNSYQLQLKTPDHAGLTKWQSDTDKMAVGSMTKWQTINQGRYNQGKEPIKDDSKLSSKSDDFFDEDELGVSSGNSEQHTIPDEFEEIWELRPRREGSDPKKPALAKYRSARKKHSYQKIRAGILAHAASREKEDPRYTPMLQTWLNQERFLEAAEAPRVVKVYPIEQRSLDIGTIPQRLAQLTGIDNIQDWYNRGPRVEVMQS